MKSDFIKILENYIVNIGDDLTLRWNEWVKDLNQTEVYEVIGGLISRQVSITKEFASNPNLWNPNIAPILMRSLIDNYINFSWILLDPVERSRKFIFFGLGQEKLLLEHRKKAQAEISDNDNQMIIEAMENWINSQNYDFLTVVNVGSWSEKSVREMAIETGEQELYNYSYQSFSSATHNMWNHISKFNLEHSENPLHRYTKVPAIFNFTPDLFWM